MTKDNPENPAWETNPQFTTWKIGNTIVSYLRRFFVNGGVEYAIMVEKPNKRGRKRRWLRDHKSRGGYNPLIKG